MPESLFDRLGGQNAVNTAVDIFYRKMLTDDRVRDFFDDVDMEQQILKQKGFLTMVLGGPNNYKGKDMREGHRHLVKRGLNDTHVDIVIEHLGETLRELGANEGDIQKVAAIANSVREDVLDR
ncbi:group I truncated hemoglobin [Legionella spiritensis]|uniref:Group 1 truncated hemoglobin n=1 Tax=Legionella spiritensis TaxID=452 RepID=A0A0W0YYD1_LEGSP|nr:group 1 truncated hemoglobin [Legionella spiritensis]KTD61832.1 myoglobin-like protein [Legionella spiritensis]SNV31649.1 myoglobin-like protein [Legionella spiritensis]